MKSYYSQEVANLLNDLMNFCFYSNLVADNIAYQLQTTLGLDNTGELYHIHFAHWFTGDEAADYLSTVMVTSNIQPKRSKLDSFDKQFENIIEAFDKNVKIFEELRDKVINVIDTLEYDFSNKQLIIQLENFLSKIVILLRKSNIILDKAIAYEKDGKTYKFEQWFADFVG